MNEYQKFLESKRQLSGEYGFDPLWIPDQAFDFQRHLIQWACRKGRAAIFADCGLGKSLMQLAWAENVARKTNGNVLILTPLAVSHQTVKEADKFGIECTKSSDGKINSKITVTNYERLHYFDAKQFQGVVCDESSILKNFNGKIREAVTGFLKSIPYRLLCTATAAPNDFMEIGTSSEALGYLKHKEMLSIYFTHDSANTSKWRLKGHASGGPFWKWMASWAVAVRTPQDLGFEDVDMKLPKLTINKHIVKSQSKMEGYLFNLPAVGLEEQRKERKNTINERCEKVKSLIDQNKGSSIAWCHLNDEGNLLEKIIPDSIQVSGSDSDEKKENAFSEFENGNIKTIITKPSIAGFGLNWQHCSHQTFFPSHSFEQWYQAVRRSWRFGQKNEVIVDVVSSDGEADVVKNLERKANQADKLFKQLVKHINI